MTGCLLFTIYRAIDLKMIYGGGVFSYEEQDYILAAVNVIIDVQIFWYSLILVNSFR